MIKKEYAYMFPYTFAAKHVIAPYNQKGKTRSEITLDLESKADSHKEGSKSAINLKDLNDFSSDNPDLQTLLLEAAEILKETTNAYVASVYLVHPELNEIWYLTGQAYMPTPPYYRFKIEEYRTIAAHVAYKKEYAMVDNIRYDSRFPKGTGYKSHLAHSVLCVPVVTPDGDCFAVFELFKTENEEPFTKDDGKIAIVVTGWMGAAIHQNIQRVSMKKQETLHDHLLNVTHRFFNETIDTSEMLTDLVAFAKETLDVLRGIFLVIDRDCDELTAEVYEEGLDEFNFQLIKKNFKTKLLQKDQGVVSLVARNGVTINVKDPSRDPRISKEPEFRTGKSIKSLLCVPISDSGGLIGILKLVNKRYGVFSKADESTLKILGVYASCCLEYNTLIKRLQKQVLQNKVLTNTLNKHLKPCPHDLENLMKSFGKKKPPPQFLDFRWYIPDSAVGDTSFLAVHMVRELCEGQIDRDNLCRFILTVKKLYRKNSYHNFEHAFNFLHCMFGIIKRNGMIFSPLEVKALLIASICHDIDHGGVTNNFLMITNDVIFQLYQESPWENYHYMITMRLLENIQVFNKLSRKEYKSFLKEIRDAILATDLQLYFKNRLKLLPIINDKAFEVANSNHRYLLKTIMMTVCDLSGQCKPYSIARKITDNVYREFYDQGDKEKSIGFPPLSMMDREKQYQIPEDQIQFLSVIVLPATEILKTILDNTEDLYSECLVLRKMWQDIVEARERKTKKKSTS
ncbi:hypothetical protein WA026_005954 [Henosepilachna vigintioctopunctata]|uniref:Phosphodiesterase n=1 Tax=Henosepilachna vigintioctopunctata TaxID=420089 RepID=A0AAW1U3C9_9CUCU